MLLNLLSSAVEGAAYLILLFGLCFGAVVGVKTINRKLREREEKPDSAEEDEEKPTPEPKPARAAAKAPPRTPAKRKAARPRAQKIYYILERAEEDKAEKPRERAKTK